MVQGKVVVLEFFIQYILGNTAGHNNLCGHKQTGCRQLKRVPENLIYFDPADFDHLTMQDLAETNGRADLLDAIGLRPGINNAFYSLPCADRHRHICGSTTFDRLYVFLQCLYKYQIESFRDMIGEKDSGKKKKEK